MIEIKPEAQEDWWEVENLFDLSFAPGRTGLSSYRLREGNDPVETLCFVARDTTQALVGAVRVYPIIIGENADDALLLGPIAVHPTVQGEGVGGDLMQKCLSCAREMGWRRVILVGDAPYYSRFGFTKAQNLVFPPPINEDRLLCLALEEHAFEGVKGDIKSP
ncbi:MAG: N-acetyltransferase [Pseudomonadota bacterium]